MIGPILAEVPAALRTNRSRSAEQTGNDQQSARRQRVSRACEQCRKYNIECDGGKEPRVRRATTLEENVHMVLKAEEEACERDMSDC